MTQTIQELNTTISRDEEISKIFANMPDALKIEVLHYAEYLLNKEIDKTSITPVANNDSSKQKYRKAGTMKGMIIMADDFDEPLIELQEYMD